MATNNTDTNDVYTPIEINFAKTSEPRSERNPFPIPTREEFAVDLKTRIQAGFYGLDLGFYNRVRKWRRLHDLVVTPKSEPWIGCSNVAPYIGRAVVETVHATFYKTILGIQPWFQFSSDDPVKSPESEQVAQMWSYGFQTIMEKFIKFKTKADDVIAQSIISGTGILLTTYRYEVRKTARMEKITGLLLAELCGLNYDGGQSAAQAKAAELQPKIQAVQQRTQAYLQANNLQLAVHGQQAVERGDIPNTDIAGQIVGEQQQSEIQSAQQALGLITTQAEQEVQIAQTAAQQKEDQDLLRLAQQSMKELRGKKIGDYAPIYRKRDVVYDNPDIEVVDLLDYVIYPSNSKSQETDIFEGRKIFRSSDDLWRGVRQGIYDKEAVIRLTRNPSGESNTEDYRWHGDPGRTYRKGIRVYAEQKAEDIPYRCYEGIYYQDIDGDGETEALWVEMEWYTGELIRAEYCPYFFQGSPFDMVKVYRIPETEGRFGVSIYEVLQHGLKVLKKSQDQRLDRADLVNSAPTAVDMTIKHNWAENRWRIGSTIRCRNPENAMVPLKIPDVTESSFMNTDSIMQDIKMASSVSDTQLQKPQSDGTALGEVRAMLDSATVRFDVLIDRCRTAFGAAATKCVQLIQQYQPAILAPFTLPDGSQQTVTMTADQIMRGMKVTVKGVSSTNNAQFKAQVAEKAYMLLERAGYTLDPVVKRHIIEKYLLDSGEDDAESLIPTVQEAIQEKLNPKPMPLSEKASYSFKVDEVTSLALLKKEGHVTDQDIVDAATTARRAENILLPPPEGVQDGQAPDQGPGYNTAQRQAAAGGNVRGQNT